jgi:glycosyltransferase involved in cell wall biosynthesis
MRIVLNAITFSPGKMGGTETYFRKLLENLQLVDTDNHYQLVCGDDVAREFTSLNPNFEVVAVRRYPRHDLRRYVFSLMRRVTGFDYVQWSFKRLSADVVHHPFTIMYPSGLNSSTVLTFWDMQHEFFPEFFSKEELERRKSHYRSSCLAATRIIVSSEFTRQSLVERYEIDSGKIDVIYVGSGAEYRVIEDRELLEGVRKKYGLARPYLYYPAATWPHKNHLRLLGALKYLLERFRFDGDLVLTGVAEHAHYEILREIDRLGLSDRVKVLGHLPYGDLPGLYNSARLLVFPSLFEGFGIPLVEAMACGCPTACSNVTSIPEVIGEAGVMFDPTSIEDIAESIWSVWTDDARLAGMRREGLRRAGLFDWENTGRKTIEVYRKASDAQTG